MADSQAKDFVQKHPSIHFLNINNAELLSRASTNDGPETFIFDQLKMRPRAMSHHLSSTKVPSRKWLKIQAKFWRSLMSFAMHLHDYAPPPPPKARFIKEIPTDTIPIQLYFYTPPDYQSLVASGHRFPIVVNFHGGGFCLGDATDDRYWARVVLERTNAVFVSVNYRRAPEHPFPIPVDDSVNALVYLSKHAHSLGLDTTRVGLSGFSAGANLTFAVPLRLKFHTLKHVPHSEPPTPDSEDPNTPSSRDPPSPNITSSTVNLLSTTPPTEEAMPLKIRTIIAWYPLLDWTMSRKSKIRTSPNPKKCLPKVFTDLFDYSYLPPPDVEGAHCSPFASPGLAPDAFLRDGLPNDIQMWLCEWDMLMKEGQTFAGRLDGLGKNVHARVIPKVPHGWDKSPNPFRDQKKIDWLYVKAAGELRTVFES